MTSFCNVFGTNQTTRDAPCSGRKSCHTLSDSMFVKMCVFQPLQCVLNEHIFFVGAARFPSVFLLILTVQSSFMLLPLASHALSITRDDSISVLGSAIQNVRFQLNEISSDEKGLILTNDFKRVV